MQQEQRLILIYKMVDDLLYGAIATLPEEVVSRGGTVPLDFSYPYVISKRLADQEIVYGSVIHLLYEAARPVFRMNVLLKGLADSLPEETRSSFTVTRSPNAITHTAPELPAAFLHIQEGMVRDALLLSGLHLRTLLEMFSGRGNLQVPLYDYEDHPIGTVSLIVLFNTLMHYRYCVIHGEYIHDIFSRTSQLESRRMFGSKVKTVELFARMIEFITSVTVNDFVGLLRGSLKDLGVDSEPREIAFVVQNVHSLEQAISDRIQDPRFGELQQLLFRQLTDDEERRIANSDGTSKIVLQRVFTSPSFKIGDNPRAGIIAMHININGKSEAFEFTHEEFFGTLSRAFGQHPLITLENLEERFRRLEGSSE